MIDKAKVSPALYDLLDKMLTKNDRLRPSVFDCLNHKFIKNKDMSIVEVSPVKIQVTSGNKKCCRSRSDHILLKDNLFTVKQNIITRMFEYKNQFLLQKLVYIYITVQISEDSTLIK